MAILTVQPLAVESTNTFTFGNVITTANLLSGNANLGNLATANFFTGNGSLLTGIAKATSADSVANGTSNVNIPAVNGNIQLASGGNLTGVITSTGVNVAGYVTATGNMSANYFIGNGSQLTGVDKLLVGNADQANYISNGTSNINTPIVNGNITVGIGGTSNTVIFTGTGINVAGYVTAGGNINASYVKGNGYYLTGIAAAASSSNVANGSSNVEITTINGNITMGVSGNANVVVISGTSVNIAGNANITGNVTAPYFIGNIPNVVNGTSNIQIIQNGNVSTSVNGNANVIVVTGAGANIIGYVNANGNVNGSNITASGQLISTLATGTAPLLVLSSTQVANLNAAVAGTVTTNAQPNITSHGTLTGLTSNGVVDFTNTSNVTLGAVGNLHISGGTSGQVLTTNGSNSLYWATTTTGGGGSNILNGTSNVSINLSGGNINASVNGNANVFVIASTGVNVAGYANITGYANVAGNLKLTGNRNDLGPVSNLSIAGGSSGFVLSTDGTGNLSWIGQSSSGGASGAIQEFIAAQGQSTFTIVGGYNVGSVIIFVNGIQMNNIDYAATNGTTVILSESRKSGDIVRVLSSMVSPVININNIKSFSLAMSIALGM